MSDTALPTYPEFAKTYHLLSEQLPQFLSEEDSNLEDILTVYYEWLETQVTDGVDMKFRNIDDVDEDFVDYFLYEFAEFAKNFETSTKDKRRLVKYIKEMYEKKGGQGENHMMENIQELGKDTCIRVKPHLLRKYTRDGKPVHLVCKHPDQNQA